MKIGFISSYSKERIDFASKNGFRSVEFAVASNRNDPFYPGQKDWKKHAADVRAEYKAAGISVTAVGGFYIDVLDEKRETEMENEVKSTILLAKELGSTVACGFSGRLIGKELEDSLPRFKKVWTPLAKFAEDAGMKIGFEHCPMGRNHLPPGGNNMMCTPEMWEKGFNEVPSKALGLEYDPSHLISQLIDPVQTIRKFYSKIHAVHAKDAKKYAFRIEQYGIYAAGSIEHCFPGLGDTDWAMVIKELYRIGYNGGMNIEGWHDAVYQNNKDGSIKREDEGLIVAKKHLEQFMVQD